MMTLSNSPFKGENHEKVYISAASARCSYFSLPLPIKSAPFGFVYLVKAHIRSIFFQVQCLRLPLPSQQVC